MIKDHSSLIVAAPPVKLKIEEVDDGNQLQFRCEEYQFENYYRGEFVKKDLNRLFSSLRAKLSWSSEQVSEIDQEFKTEAKNIEKSISAAAYDTAWIARIRQPGNPQRLAFPYAFNWLLANQSSAGSWGGFLPDSLLPTMAGLVALLSAPPQYQTAQTQEAILKAKIHLQEGLAWWKIDQFEGVGFEILMPALLQELQKLEVEFDFPAKEHLLKLHVQKLQIAAPALIYSGKSNLIHSLEAFGSAIDFKRLKTQQAANGSYGCSPAATAAVLIYGEEWDEKAAGWLNELSNLKFDGTVGTMPNVYPIDTFEVAWVLFNLLQNPAGLTQAAETSITMSLVNWLQDSLASKGASISLVQGLPPDADDTGLVIATLNQLGIPTSIQPLLHFERENHFACFELERGISVSANAHVLDAFLSLPLFEQSSYTCQMNKLVNFLLESRNKAGYWMDKWHASPYYASACAVLTLNKYPSPKVKRELLVTMEWLLQTQSLYDGGWGSQGYSTMEETAYALQMLKALSQPTQPATTMRENCERSFRQGLKFLRERFKAELYNQPLYQKPKLWRGKELYCPYQVVEAAIFSVLL